MNQLAHARDRRFAIPGDEYARLHEKRTPGSTMRLWAGCMEPSGKHGGPKLAFADYSLARQLVAAGERVLDVQPKLGARVRLLAAGDTNKNDPNDARWVAVAALRSASRREVTADDHAVVLRAWSKRHRDLGRSRTQVACRLHAVLCELVPAASPRTLPQLTPLTSWSGSRRPVR